MDESTERRQAESDGEELLRLVADATRAERGRIRLLALREAIRQAGTGHRAGIALRDFAALLEER